MVLRFPLQLESSNLDNKNSSYGILHSDYSNLQNRSRFFFLAHSSPFEGFLGTLCDTPKPGGPLTTRQPAEYKWMSGYPTPLQKIGQSLLCTGSSTQIQNMYTPAYTCPKQSNICNIYPNMSKNASWAHKPILIKSIIITILQLSPNNSIVDYTFILYKHILKSTILIHVMSKNHQATNRLLQNQPQNELSPRALSVPEIRGIPRRGELKLSRRIALSGLLTT